MDAPTIQTERLLLRPFSEDDVGTLATRIFGDPDVMATLPHDPQTDDEYLACAKEYIDLYTAPWPDQDYGGWAVCSRSDDLGPVGELLGFCGFEPGHIEGLGLELGFGYSRMCWGKGVGLEAAEASRDWFKAQTRWDRFYACFVPGNKGSERIIQKLGMTYVDDMDLWGSVEKGVGLLPVYTFDREPT